VTSTSSARVRSAEEVRSDPRLLRRSAAVGAQCEPGIAAPSLDDRPGRLGDMDAGGEHRRRGIPLRNRSQFTKKPSSLTFRAPLSHLFATSSAEIQRRIRRFDRALLVPRRSRARPDAIGRRARNTRRSGEKNRRGRQSHARLVVSRQPDVWNERAESRVHRYHRLHAARSSRTRSRPQVRGRRQRSSHPGVEKKNARLTGISRSSHCHTNQREVHELAGADRGTAGI